MFSRMALLVAAMLLVTASPAASQPAPHRECFRFRHIANQSVEIELAATTLTVHDRGEATVLTQIISKPYGQLISVAVDPTGKDPQEHYFDFREINGREMLVFDSQVFVPVCKRPSLAEWRATEGGDRITRVSEFQSILRFKGDEYSCTIDHEPEGDTAGILSCNGRRTFSFTMSDDDSRISIDGVAMDRAKPLMPFQ